MCPLTMFFLLMTVAETQSLENAERDLRKGVQRWNTYYQREAAGYDIFLGHDRKYRLRLRKEPIFRWGDPTNEKEMSGAFFVWTDSGQAKAIGLIWSSVRQQQAGKRTVVHSLHSLARQPLEAVREGQTFWHPKVAGIDPKPIPGAPVPAQSPRLRLVQMRALAAQFKAVLTNGRGMKKELERQSHPCYRYEGSREDSLDGALFVYYNETLQHWDPELVLIIETRQTEEGAQWHYAAARYSFSTVRLYHKDTAVWSYLRASKSHRDPNHTYYSIHGASLPDTKSPE